MASKSPRSAPGVVKKRRKTVPGMKAIREIRQQQKNTDYLIPRMAFARLVREIVQSFLPAGESYRIQAIALLALQEAAECFLINFLEGGQRIALVARRITLKDTDCQLALSLQMGERAYEARH